MFRSSPDPRFEGRRLSWVELLFPKKIPPNSHPVPAKETYLEIGFLQDAIKLRRGEIILDLGGGP